MSRTFRLVTLAAMFILATALVANAAGQTKSGTIKSVDAKAKTFTLDFGANTLTFTVNDKTTITLGGKASTLEEAIKVDAKADVTYEKSGEARVAAKVAVTAAAATPAK